MFSNASDTRRVFYNSSPLPLFYLYTPSSTMSSPALPPSATSPTQSRPIIDPLAFNEVRGLQGTQSAIDARSRRGGSEAEEDNGDGTVQRPRRGPTGVNVDDIPRVKDTTGEMVMDSFALFLEKYEIPFSALRSIGGIRTDDPVSC
jgi:hypothetical protein